MSIFTYIKSHTALVGTVGVLAVAGGVIAGRAATAKPQVAVAPQVRSVTMIDASTFRTGTSTVSADGIVEAHDQADLRAQLGGQIATVNVSIGDYVSAGETLMEFSNADLRAQLQSATANLAIAEGGYTSARQGAIDKVRSAYLAADTAMHGQVDQYILNTVSPTPQLFTFVTDPALGSRIKDERSDLTTRFSAWRTVVDSLSASSSDAYIHAAVVTSEDNLDAISTLLDNISTVLSTAANVAVSTTLPSINAIQTVVSTARGSISAAKSALVASESNLEGFQVSGNSAAQASVSAAEGNVKNLTAQLAKTVITSPISGRISALPLTVGEFASPGALLATVVGTNGLMVRARASANDLARIRPGASVTLDNGAHGTVTNVAPGVSSDTKQGEVDINIISAASSGLVVGQNVHAHVSAVQQGETTSQDGTTHAAYILPIQDVKIVPGAASVFTVDTDSRIVSHPVSVGAIDGNFVEVTSGLTDDMRIATPVYELEDGQTVVTQ